MRSFGRTSSYLQAGLLALLVICLALLAACGESAEAPEATPVQPVETPTATEPEEEAEGVRISELMSKNRAVLRDEDGDFSDWIELENFSDTDVDLGGWLLSDRENRKGWTLPEITLPAGERLLIFADGKDRRDSLHTNFSLSAGETLYLFSRSGKLASSALCSSEVADISVRLTEEGSYEESVYPTPGCPNTNEGYEQWQSSLESVGPLVIDEVVVSNLSGRHSYLVGNSDWVEIRNISDQAVNLSDYCLSDDKDNYCLWRFPAVTLKPGQLYLVCCDTEGSTGTSPCCMSFSLDSSSEKLYLAGTDGSLIDYASLRDIPYGGSYGRMPGKNGWFYFDSVSPGAENSNGYRRIAPMPTVSAPDGVYNNVSYVTVTLNAPGTIYYTTDGSLPTAASHRYTGPVELTKTGIIRALNWETGAMPSRVLTLSYILNEEHSLPVVSLVSDDKMTFNGMYYYGTKDIETSASLSYYGEDGSFTIPCGVRMQGGTSLELPKKNMSVRFRGAYGEETLSYDLFGGGVTVFTNLLLRAGQDYYATIFRNELCENLARSASRAVVTQRSRYCVLYVDGRYYGIYALMEKANEQLYADWMGVSRDSVTTVDADHTLNTELYREVLSYCIDRDMSDPEAYAYFCARVDAESMVDWFLLEGYCANSDLTWGNLRYCRSTEGDGKWRFMFYDLDATFLDEELNYYNLLSDMQLDSKQICQVFDALLGNEAFRDLFLTRAGEMLNGPLTNDKVLAEIDRLAAQVEPEVERDYVRHGLDYNAWVRDVEALRSFIVDKDWRQHNIDTLCTFFKLDEQQREHYFGS